MTSVFVAVGGETVTEATATARVLEGTGAGFYVGPHHVFRAGVGLVGVIRPFGPVLADLRVGGADAVPSARAVAAAGASMVGIGPGVGPEVVAAVIDAVRPYGARVAVTLVPPEASGADVEVLTGGVGRGRSVSRMAAALGDLDVVLMGPVSDIGVVAQVAPGRGVVAWTPATVEAVGDAVERGARGVVVPAPAAAAGLPRDSVARLVDAFQPG